MKINEVIRYAGLVEKGNVMEEELAVLWLSELDGMIQSDIMLHSPEEIVSYTSEEDELLLKPPHDKLYVHYLVMMIRQQQQEYEGYQNAQAVVDEKLRTFRRWYVQHYRPAGSLSDNGAVSDPGTWGFAYITAYGLAVQQGYRGTLDEWLASLKGETGEAARMRYDEERETVQWGVGEQWYDLFTLSELRDPVVDAIIGQATAAAEAAEGAAREAQTEAQKAQQSMERAGLSAQSANAAAEVAETAAVQAADAATDARADADRAEDAAQMAWDEAGSAAGYAEDAEEFANRAEEAARSIGVGGVKVTDGANVGVWLQAEGTEREPVLHLYGDHGDEPTVVRNVARAELDRDAVPLGQVKDLVAAAGGGGAGLPADLFGGYDRFYRSIARGRVNPEEPLVIDTYDGSGQLTHPCVRHFPEGFGGHSWWMTASPYPNSALELENPCVWYSDDGIHWSADGIPNPLDEPLYVTGEQASMNSDPHLLVRPDGVMEVWWRTNYWENSGEGLYTVVYRRTSTDGVNWTAKEELHRMLTNSADGIVCPVALYEDGVYKIWAVSDQECLRYYESATGADWRHIRDIDVSNPDYPEYKVWHFDVNHTAKGYEFVGCYNIPGDYTSHKYLYYAVSQDNITYSKRVMILTRGAAGSFDERLVYRPTIVRMADRVRIYYGANNADNVWSIGLIEAPSAYLFNAVLISGARVGAIESGQEWLDGRVTALEALGGGGDSRPADEGVTVVRSFDESPWLPGYWDPSNDGELTLYSNMHRTQLVELASLTVDGALPEITAKSSVAAWALVRFNYFDGNLRWIGADMGAITDPSAGTQEPTRLTWPAGAVYVAISANTADKGAVTVSGVPEGGGCEISQEQIREIAGIAAGMVPGGGGVGAWKLADTVTTDVEINYAALRIPDGATETLVLMDVPAADESRTIAICAWVAESRAWAGYAAPEFVVGDKARKIVFRHSRIVDVVHCLYGSSGVYVKTADPIVGNYVSDVTGNYLSIGGVYASTMIPTGSTITMYAR